MWRFKKIKVIEVDTDIDKKINTDINDVSINIDLRKLIMIQKITL